MKKFGILGFDALYWYMFILVGFSFSEGSNNDPCDSSVYKTSISDITSRSPSKRLESYDTAICDRYLSKAWYRIDGYQLPDKPPQSYTCSTFYPIWRKGDLPIGVNQIKDVEMCIVRFSNTCSRSMTIKIKKCTDFLVYELKPTDYCSAAYCFEWKTQCVNEKILDVFVEYFDYFWENVSNADEGANMWDSSIRFLCNFTFLKNESIFYKILWKLDDLDIDLNQVVNRTTSGTALLSAYDMLKYKKKINTVIRCSVAPKSIDDEDTCLATSSPPFFAGFMIQNTVIRLHESDSADIYIKQTIPFADFFSKYQEQNYFEQNLAIELVPPSTSCTNSIINYARCRIEVKPLRFHERHNMTDQNWNKTLSFKIYAKQSDRYDIPDTEVTLLLRTSLIGDLKLRNGSRIFHHAKLQKVTVQKTSGKYGALSKECSSMSDPYVTTFDKVWYKSQENEGQYLLYRNPTLDQEVHAEQRVCHSEYPYAFCNCALAARAGRDIFVVDICDGGSFDIVDYTLCDDKILTVVKKSDTKYEIRMPSGTTISVSLMKWPEQMLHLDIVITPSVRDFNSTQGLCGILDNDPHNDFTRSNGVVDSVDGYDGSQIPQIYYANPPTHFLKSWQFGFGEGMLPEKSMFTQDELLFESYSDISKTNVLLCTCKRVPNDSYDTTDCSFDHTVSCSTNTTNKINCDTYTSLVISNSNRKKRKASYSIHGQKEIKPLIPRHHLHRRNTHTVMSTSEAEKICLEAFASYDTYSLCREHTPQMSNISFINCVMDVMITGDVNITDIHVAASADECLRIATHNASIEAKDPDFFNKISNMCPLNCSNHGSCDNGTCTCDKSFSGSDCSFDRNSLPDIMNTRDSVLCDKAERFCDESVIYGRFFLDNAGLRCLIRRSVDIINSSVRYSSFYNEPLKARTILEGRCPLMFSDISIDNAWIFTFEYNITNDRHQYSETMTTIVYDSVCQDAHKEGGNIFFTLKKTYCFIDGVCYPNRSMNITDSCWFCDPSITAYSWIFNKDCNKTGPKLSTEASSIATGKTTKTPIGNNNHMQNDDLSKYAIGLISAMVLATIVLLFLIVYWIKAKYLKRKKCQTYIMKNQELSNERHPCT